jgi:hypothetical protein
MQRLNAEIITGGGTRCIFIADRAPAKYNISLDADSARAGTKAIDCFCERRLPPENAGHGMEVGGENWLIPTDAELRSDTDVESEAVSMRSVNLQVAKARQLGLVILDACRNNPFDS